jgi:hypothetical protein
MRSVDCDMYLTAERIPLYDYVKVIEAQTLIVPTESRTAISQLVSLWYEAACVTVFHLFRIPSLAFVCKPVDVATKNVDV